MSELEIRSEEVKERDWLLASYAKDEHIYAVTTGQDEKGEKVYYSTQSEDIDEPPDEREYDVIFVCHDPLVARKIALMSAYDMHPPSNVTEN